jgi:hypothetical protein
MSRRINYESPAIAQAKDPYSKIIRWDSFLSCASSSVYGGVASSSRSVHGKELIERGRRRCLLVKGGVDEMQVGEGKEALTLRLLYAELKPYLVGEV